MKTAIFKQEWKESWRNKRLIWVPVALMLLAAMQPLTLYFLPDILAAGGNLPEGAVIEIPPPSPAEVLLSAGEQLRQIGLLVVLLSAMHTFSQERSLGTLAWLKSLHIPATRIVISKWAHYALLSSVSILLAQGTAAYYTFILFDKFDVTDFAVSTGLLIVHFLVQLSIFFLFAALLESGLVALVITLGGHLVLSLLIGWLEWDWLPWRIGGMSGEVLLMDVEPLFALLTGVGLIAGCLVVASKQLRFLSKSS
ncbi:ABC transporter permease [Exiguobacterium sp.]|uniref:ABC transporter permease n=1 Tax=Exiguobacterium sp. TaxID=44751 RepID=UPI00391A5831